MRTERLRELLLRAARMQMVSDVPLGAFLSGGIDSCSLVALMMKVSGRPVHTYSIGFAGLGAQLDETADAQRSADSLGAVHLSVPVTGEDVADALPGIAGALGQPTVDGINMYFVSRAARRGVTVALTGIGGDEMFSGYPWVADIIDAWGGRAPGGRFGAALGATGFWKVLPRTRMRENWEFRSLRRDLPSHYMMSHMIRPPSEALRLVAGGMDVKRGDLFAYLGADDPEVRDAVSRVSRLDALLYMGCQLLRDADTASMAHSLEVRVPFLDVELAEFAYGLPGAAKRRPLAGESVPTGKAALVEAVRDLIPEWTYRKPKRGFSMPFAEWLRGPLRTLAEDTLADPAFRASGLLEKREVDRARLRFAAGHEEHWTRVWSLIMLALWWRSVSKHASMTGTVAGTRRGSPRPAENTVVHVTGG